MKSLLREVLEAIKELAECWETPDSPEAMAYAMERLLELRERMEIALSKQ